MTGLRSYLMYACVGLIVLVLIGYLPWKVYSQPVSTGGPIVFAWPIPCAGPPGVWTVTLSFHGVPLPVPVVYPYPALPLIVKSNWLPPAPGVTALGVGIPGGCATFYPCAAGLCPVFLEGLVEVQYGSSPSI